MDPRIERPSLEREVEEELRFHVDMRVRELVGQGWSEDEARAEAVRRLGDVERVKARMRKQGRGREMKTTMGHLWDETRQNLAFAWRQLRRAPAFATTAMLTLAVAIGAGTAVFSVLNAVLLRPLPYPEPDRLSIVWTRYLPASGFDISKFFLSVPEFYDLREGARSFERLGMWTNSTRTLTGDGEEAERVAVGLFSRDMFPVLGVTPLHGRWFSAAEDTPGAAPTMILGYDLWQRRFGGDPAVVGRSLDVNGEATQVVGVMPQGFAFPRMAEAYLPLGIDQAAASSYGRGAHGWGAVGRRHAGVTQADLDAELALIGDRWAEEFEHNEAHFAWAATLKEDTLGDAPGILLSLSVAVGLVLLIGCANVANLLLARGERRHVEVAVRAALGADAGRITRQLVTESLLLAVGGAVLGLGLAYGGTRLLIGMDPGALPRLEQVQVDGTVLLFALGAAVATTLLFGVVPALLAGRRVGRSVAAASSRSTGSRARSRLRRALVTGEVALGLVVVIVAGLMGRTMAALTAADPGLEVDNVLTFTVSLPTASYPEDAQVPDDMGRMVASLRALPSVTAVAASSALPYSRSSSRWDFLLDDRPPREEGDQAWSAEIALVLPGYFEALGIPVLEGRGFTESDRADGAMVGVVSETMARTFWPGESPVGKRWAYPSGDSARVWITAVGVVPDQVNSRVDQEANPQIYLPAHQSGISAYGFPRTYQVAVRSPLGPETVTEAVRRAVADFDADLPLYDVTTLEETVTAAYADTRLVTTLLVVFAFIALVLAAVGIYGVVSYSVAGRTREIGIRVALGARRHAVIRMIIGEGIRPVLLGLLLGLSGAWFARELVASLLFGVSENDPVTFTVLPLALLLVGAAASLVPALRATRIAPTEALREE